ncbi:hypothetical protein DFH29DRAFT_802033 [Suillus ampliporus]|nr:hypothetical protein DFH29DRAFT_802033 [Suillus ampliporus]
MPAERLPIFHGDGRALESPADFFRSFNRAMREQSMKMDNEKIEVFEDYLGTGSQAETWFSSQGMKDKALWTAFATAFKIRWPPITIAEKTKAEYELELLEHTLANENVRKKTTLQDKECWTHVAWAAQALQLAMNTDIAASSSMIWQVHRNLPTIIKDMLADVDFKDWTEFMEVVKKLNGVRIIEKKEQKMTELSTLQADLVARIPQRVQQQNLIAALQSQLSRMSLSSPTPPSAPLINNTFTHVPMMQTHQNTPQQPPAITKELKTIIRQLVNIYPQHPDNPSGHVAYTSQVAQWNAKWGENTRVTHETGYPLKPGTAIIASNECFGCGTHRRNSCNCPLLLDHKERLTRCLLT